MPIENARELVLLRILILLVANLASYVVLEPVAVFFAPDARAGIERAGRKDGLALCVRLPATRADGALVASGDGVQEREGC